MKVVILHGTSGSPEGNWFPWLKRELENLGHEVFVPKFPTPENQSVDNWCKALREQTQFEFDRNTILVGHSCGATYMLSILNQDRAEPLKATIFVSGFLHDLGDEAFDIPNHTFTNQDFDWDLIKKNAGQIFVIAGDNDPYVPKSETEELAKNLSVEPIYIKNGGHLNAEFGYIEFPALLEIVKKIAKE
ncbi:alpha/beta hydrolase [Candidatus Saccharibacteria bacterium]|nr:alpha/beta hydrolase [Candidatus Saccharibacteria bacterium]